MRIFNTLKKAFSDFFHPQFTSSQVCLGLHHDFFVDIPMDHLFEESIEKEECPPYHFEYDVNFSISDDVNIEKLKSFIIRDCRVYIPYRLRDGISVNFSDDLKTYEVNFIYDLN